MRPKAEWVIDAIHGLPDTVRMLRVKSDKSDWLWSQSIVFTNPFKTRMSLDLARGPQRSDECAYLSHARTIERAWEWVAPFPLETSKRQNGGRLKFRSICFHFAGIRRKQNS